MRPFILLLVLAVAFAACLNMPPRPGPDPGPGVDAFVPPPDTGSGNPPDDASLND
jgi:hypothetical protein